MIALHTNLDGLEGVLGVMVPIVAIVGGISFAIASRYLKSKERMEMISRGMDISALKGENMDDFMEHRRKRSPLRGGLVFVGVGLGLLVSYGLCHTVFTGDDNEAIYFGVIALFVGIALVISHVLEPQQAKDTQAK